MATFIKQSLDRISHFNSDLSGGIIGGTETPDTGKHF
jgi:hypothetical protein